MSKSTRRLWSSATIISMGLTIALVGVAATSNVNAIEGETDHAPDTRQTMTTENTSPSTDRQNAIDQARAKATEAREAAKTKAHERREVAREKLTAAKLKACEKRQVNITNRTSRIADRGVKHLALFNTIAERAKAFYAERGKTLANYDTLVATVDAKKSAAEAAVNTIADSTSAFVCTEGNPKDIVADFKANVLARKTALMEYRTAIKDLIVGIKSVNSTMTNNEAKTEETE